MAFTLSGDAATTRTNLGLGDAATKTTGTASGNIPVLDSSGKIPSSTVDALPSGGSVGQLVTNTAAGTGTWQDAAAGGKVLQVVQTEYSTYNVTTSTTYIDTGLTATITPSSTSSKILVIAEVDLQIWGNTGNVRGQINLVGSTNGTVREVLKRSYLYNGSGSLDHDVTVMIKLDSPSTTSAETYKVQMKGENGITIGINEDQGTNPTCSITLIEIGA